MRPRDRMMLPLGGAITVAWLVTLAVALYRDEMALLAIPSTPFVMLCGYVFGASIVRRAENGGRP